MIAATSESRDRKGPTVMTTASPGPFTRVTCDRASITSGAPEAGPRERLLPRLRSYVRERLSSLSWPTLSGLQHRLTKRYPKPLTEDPSSALPSQEKKKSVHRPVPVDGRTGRRAFICDFSFPLLLLLLPERWVGHCIFSLLRLPHLNKVIYLPNKDAVAARGLSQ